MCESCSICLNPVRRTRNTPQLKCGHVFHTGCLEEWEDRGGETCPLCRKTLSGAEYRVKLTIENLNTSTSNTYSLSADIIRSIMESLHLEDDDLARFSTEINFDVNNLDELGEVLSEFGIPNLDSLVPDAE